MSTVLTKRTATGLVAVMAVAGLLLPAAAQSAQAAPRMTLDECEAHASNPEWEYTVVDPGDNTKCTSNPDGSFIWVWDAVIEQDEYARGNAQFFPKTGKPVKKGLKVTVYFIRGNLTLRKRVPIESDGSIKFRRKLKRSGTWAVIITRGGRTISTTINVG